jgi:hypothetical protein
MVTLLLPERQANIRAGRLEDVFPYAVERRFG